uniref:Uncharacterized protein n=1 Tax=Tanacetum cinerariifolium TaxID=118510 RepID=A0A6L2MK81_TANCI|nr:hypothetical protein [Tanacetum cinerariifolium]
MRRLNQVSMGKNKRWIISNLHSSFGDVEGDMRNKGVMSWRNYYLSYQLKETCLEEAKVSRCRFMPQLLSREN